METDARLGTLCSILVFKKNAVDRGWMTVFNERRL